MEAEITAGAGNGSLEAEIRKFGNPGGGVCIAYVLANAGIPLFCWYLSLPQQGGYQLVRPNEERIKIP
jgi:hypothetical protein